MNPTTQPGAGLTDEQLLELYRGGQERALGVLIERYQVELFHFLYRFTNNQASAEDLFQETFLQVHLSAESFDLTRKLRPWIFTIAANKARDLLRRNNRRAGAAAITEADARGDHDWSPLETVAADLALPQEDLERKEVQERVRAVVEKMPEHLREILVLAYFHQQPYREVAQTLSLPLGTVKSRLHAAVATFAQLWKDEMEGLDEAIEE